jgi:hypothetical protein
VINWDIKVCLDIDFNCWKNSFKYKILGAWTFLKIDGSSSAIGNQHQQFVNVKTHGNIFRKLTNPIFGNNGQLLWHGQSSHVLYELEVACGRICSCWLAKGGEHEQEEFVCSWGEDE